MELAAFFTPARWAEHSVGWTALWPKHWASQPDGRPPTLILNAEAAPEAAAAEAAVAEAAAEAASAEAAAPADLVRSVGH